MRWLVVVLVVVGAGCASGGGDDARSVPPLHGNRIPAAGVEAMCPRAGALVLDPAKYRCYADGPEFICEPIIPPTQESYS